MGIILALDLGKFKTVACWYDRPTGEARFQTTISNRTELCQLIKRETVEMVVFEACTLAGWVFDLCRQLKVEALVASTNGEAWKWKNIKRKTDRDDALKLAKLAALGQLPQVRPPEKPVREKRSLLSYRQGLVTRRVAVQNRIRAVLLAQGLAAPRGHRAWTQVTFFAECVPYCHAGVPSTISSFRAMSLFLSDGQRKRPRAQSSVCAASLLRYNILGPGQNPLGDR
jgi:transposase